jgi:hypothetical protein
LSGVRVIISVICAAGVAAASGSATAAAAGAATPLAATPLASPAQRVTSAFNAALGQSSVRWVTSESANGVKVAIISDVGHSEGSQIITWSEGQAQGVLSVVLVKHTAYMIGNGAGLYLQGFTAAAATKEANKWIAVTTTSPAYAAAAAGLTVSSALGPLMMAGPVTAVPGSKILGVSTVGFQGTSKAFQGQPGVAEKLYVRATGTPLPVQVVQKSTTTVFDNWGEPIKVSVPLGAVALQAAWLRTK